MAENNEQNSQIAERTDLRNSALFQTQFETPLGPRVLASQPLPHMRAGASTAPRPESHLEHARAAWRQLLTTAAGAKLAGPRAARVGFFLGFGMIGQKTLYSFFSPNPARKRSACSPEPADPGTGVAAVAQSGDVAVRSG